MSVTKVRIKGHPLITEKNEDTLGKYAYRVEKKFITARETRNKGEEMFSHKTENKESKNVFELRSY